jgi:hypothetical protein
MVNTPNMRNDPTEEYIFVLIQVLMFLETWFKDVNKDNSLKNKKPT